MLPGRRGRGAVRRRALGRALDSALTRALRDRGCCRRRRQGLDARGHARGPDELAHLDVQFLLDARSPGTCTGKLGPRPANAARRGGPARRRSPWSASGLLWIPFMKYISSQLVHLPAERAGLHRAADRRLLSARVCFFRGSTARRDHSLVDRLCTGRPAAGAGAGQRPGRRPCCPLAPCGHGSPRSTSCTSRCCCSRSARSCLWA